VPARSAFTCFRHREQSPATIIAHFPEFLQTVLTPLRSVMSSPQFSHLRWMVLALAMNPRKAKLTHLSGLTPRGGQRTSRGCFLSARWDAPSVLIDQALRTLDSMRPKKGETLYLLIDETRIGKRGKQMEALSKIWDHKNRCFVRGHMVVSAAAIWSVRD
jgi:hypothetical protein